jgi:uncharacterized protein (TIGR02186 family)
MRLRGPVAAAIVLALLLVPARPASSEGSAPVFRIEPAEIQMGFSYSGASVEITGTVPAGHEVAIVCAGEAGRVELKKRGKVWGVLWMNVGDLTFEQVPSLYIVTTSGKLEDLAPAATREQLGIGYAALSSRIVGTSDDPEKDRLFLELISLREKEGLFSQTEGDVRVEQQAGDVEQITASCRFPTKTPPGKYEVRVYAFKNHEGRLIHSGAVEARQVGVASAIVRLSRERGLLYGVVAVVIALAVGLLTGLVFGLGTKKTG